MSEELSNTPESVAAPYIEPGEFEDPEVQKHFKAITERLPLYREFEQELATMMDGINQRLSSPEINEHEKKRLESDKAVLIEQRIELQHQIRDLNDELVSLSSEENQVHDLIKNWRKKLGITEVEGEKLAESTEEPAKE